MRPELMSLYSAVLLPLFLMYLLVILRMLERRQIPYEERSSAWSILSVRDAALVTLALDLAELAGAFAPAFFWKEAPLSLAVPGVLLALHLMVYLLAIGRHFHRPPDKPRTSTSSILDAYFSLTLLMTNAVTLMDIMRALGKGL